MFRIHTRTAFVSAAALALAVSPAWAADTWDGDTSNLWDTGTNWASGAAPDQVTPEELSFPTLTGGSYVVDLGGNSRTARNLIFNSTSPYTIQNGTLVINRTTSNSNAIELQGSSQATIEDLTISSGTQTNRIIGNANTKLTLTGDVDSTARLVSIRSGVVQLDGTWNSNELNVDLTGHLIVNGSLTASGTNGLVFGGTASSTVTLELGEDAAITGILNVQTFLSASSVTRIRLSDDVTSKTLTSILRFGGGGSNTNQVEFDGNGGDITFDSEWSLGGGSNTTTAAVAIGAGRTITVLGNFTQQNTGGTKSLALSGGGTLVHGDSISDQYELRVGGVTITNATFIINSTMTQTGAAINVNADGVLGGTGSINRVVNVNADGTLAPGNSIGTLTINNTLTLDGSSTSDFEIDDVLDISDLVAGITTLTYGGTLNVTNLGDDSGYYDGQIFDLFDFTSQSGTFAAVNLPTLPGGYQWKLFGSDLIDYTTGQIEIVGIPEPASLALVLAGALLMAPYRGRGRRADEFAAV